MGSTAIDMTGAQIGHLTVLGRKPNITRTGRSCVVWQVRCVCGVIKPMTSQELRRNVSGPNKSCGCRTGFRHGLTGTALYSVWQNMVQRCERPGHPWWRRYGGRGIKVCTEWRKDVRAFVRWALANGYRQGLEIDRIDNDGNYEPANCRFVTHSENLHNRSPFKRVKETGTPT